MNRVTINEQVAITQMGFKKDLAAYPRRMEFRGTIYEFLDAGLRCLVRTGSQVAEVLTMTDGIKQFQLRSDNRGGNWTLVSILS
ncbi:MAG: hypothetical protein WAR37_03615 [Candidatus Microsaccharimonas sp.]